MLRIRLSRTGKKRQPSYRVVVAEKGSKRDGRVVERIGHYNPLPNPAEYQIDEARALYWLSVGAQPSDAVRILLQKQGTMDRLTRFHGGESLDTLVTEFTGVTSEPTPVAKTMASESAVVDDAEPTIVERVADTARDAVAAVAAPVAVVAEKVEEVVETAVENIEDAIEAVLDADEEE